MDPINPVQETLPHNICIYCNYGFMDYILLEDCLHDKLLIIWSWDKFIRVTSELIMREGKKLIDFWRQCRRLVLESSQLNSIGESPISLNKSTVFYEHFSLNESNTTQQHSRLAFEYIFTIDFM